MPFLSSDAVGVVLRLFTNHDQFVLLVKRKINLSLINFFPSSVKLLLSPTSLSYFSFNFIISYSFRNILKGSFSNNNNNCSAALVFFSGSVFKVLLALSMPSNPINLYISSLRSFLSITIIN